MKNNKLFLLLLITLWLNSCSKTTQPATISLTQPITANSVNTYTPHIKTLTPLSTPSPTYTKTLISSVTASQTLTHTPTPLPPSPTPTPTPKPTLTSTPDAQLDFQCLKIEAQPPSGAQIKGKLFLSVDFYKPSYFLDMTTGKLSLLPEKNGASVYSAAVSPDGKWLAYEEYVLNSTTYPYSLVILSADGKTRKVLAWENDWNILVTWLDNTNIVISKARGRYDLNSIVLLNPFSGERKELIPDYPNIYDWYPMNDWLGYSLAETVYDPTLTRVVYPGIHGFVLRDVSSGKDLAVIPDTISMHPIPKWSSDGAQVILVGTVSNVIPKGSKEATDQALFSISRDGQVQRLTYLTAIYSKIRIGQLNWSPDGRYIAFWLAAQPASYPDLYPNTINSPDVPRLAVLDTTTHIVTNYCVPSDSVEAPIWSPDSSMVVGKYYDKPESYHVVVVNIVDGYAIEVAKDLTPVGWLASP